LFVFIIDETNWVIVIPDSWPAIRNPTIRRMR